MTLPENADTAPQHTHDHSPKDDGQEPIPQSHALVTQALKTPTSLFARVMNWFGFRDSTHMREDFEEALAGIYAGDTQLSSNERQMLNNVLRLREVRVADVMIPRGDIEAIDMKTSLGDLLILFEQSGHSRMPVYMDSLDDPRGMVHIRDVVGYLTKTSRKNKRRRRDANGEMPPKEPHDINGVKLDFSKIALDSSIGQLKLHRQVLFVPPSMLVADLMLRMQAQRIQMALVIDEYGGTDGLVSLEDIVEVIVGNIEDEHDDETPNIEKVSDGVFVVDARTELATVAEVIGSPFDDEVRDMDMDTIGGLIFQALGRIPARREIVKALPGYEFEVMSVDARRIRNVQIRALRHADPRRRATSPKIDLDKPDMDQK